jgi:hypothetical protein
MALAYIDARDVQDRLDECCGIGGWQNRYVPMHDKKTVCEIGIRIGEEWVWKSDGAGDSDIEAEKGALSDSFKRAAVKWGIGRYLYDLDSPWVALEPAGKSFKIAAHEHKRLEALLAGKAAPAPKPLPQPQPSPQKPLDAEAKPTAQWKAEGLAEAEKGSDQLYLWWRALPKPVQLLLTKYKDETLKPAAERADKVMA